MGGDQRTRSTAIAWVLGGAAVLAGLWLLYVAGAYLWLRSGGAQSWLGGNGRAGEYGSGWSVTPGTFHLSNVQLRGKSGSTSYALKIPELTLDVALLDSLFGSAHVERLRAEGVDLRVAMETENPFRQKAFPPIQAPPAQEDEQPPSEWAIDELDLQCERLWILGYNYQGPAHAQGGASSREGGIAIEDLRLKFQGGTLKYGTEIPLFEQLDASAKASLSTGSAPLLRRAQLDIELDAHLKSVHFLTAYLNPDRQFELREGAGGLSGSLYLRDGRLSQGSSLRFSTDQVQLQTPRFTAQGPLRLELDAKDGRLDITAHQQTVTVLATKAKSVGKPAARLQGIDLSLQTDADLTSSEPDVVGHLKVPRTELPDLSLLNALSQTKTAYTFGDGRAELTVDTRFEQGSTITSKLEGTLENGQVTFSGGMQAGADGDMKFTLAPHEGDLTRGWIRDIEVQLENAYMEENGQRVEGWSGKLTCEELSYEGFLPHQFSGEFEGTLDNGKVVFAALDLFDKPFNPSMGVPRADLDGHVFYQRDVWDVLIRDFDLGPVGARGRMRVRNGEKSMVLRMGPSHYKLGLIVQGEDATPKRRASEAWLRSTIEEVFGEYPASGVSL